MKKKNLLRASLLMLGVGIAGGLMVVPTFAQQIGGGVLNRDRPEYDPIGIPAGGFRLFPAVLSGISSDDNVFRTDTAAIASQNDTYYLLAPRFILESQWVRHELNLSGGFEHLEYSTLNGETRTNWNTGANGRLDATRATVINGTVNYSALHEPRFSPDSPNSAIEPISYSIGHFNAGLQHRPNRFGISGGVSVDNFDFDDVPLVGGDVLDNDDRDRQQYEVFGLTSYQTSPGYAVFYRVSINERNFNRARDRSGLNRSSDGYRINGGVQFLVGDLINGEIYVGYLRQNFAAPLKDVKGFDYGVALLWNPTPLLSLRLNGARTVSPTTIAGSSASDNKSFSVNIDHELLRNVILQGGVGYSDNDFQNHEDKIVTTQAGFIYLIDRSVRVNVRYNYRSRDSSLAGQRQDYTDNIFFIGLDLRL